MRKPLVVSISLLTVFFLACFSAQGRLVPGDANTLPRMVTSHGTFKLGKKPYPAGTREQWIAEGRVLGRAPENYIRRPRTLKGSADNRSILPPIGNQGSEGSCVHWAGAGMMSRRWLRSRWRAVSAGRRCAMCCAVSTAGL